MKILATKISPFFLCIATIKLQKIVTLISDYCVYYKNASVNSKRRNYLRTLWNPSYKEQYCTAQKRCSAGKVYCTQCPHFSTLSQDELKYHFAKKFSVPRPSITYKCKLCHAKFSSFYALRQHKNTRHGTQIGFGAKNFDVEDIVGDVDDQSLRIGVLKTLFDRY